MLAAGIFVVPCDMIMLVYMVVIILQAETDRNRYTVIIKQMVDSNATDKGTNGSESKQSQWSTFSFESAIAPDGPILGKLTRGQCNKLQY